MRCFASSVTENVELPGNRNVTSNNAGSDSFESTPNNMPPVLTCKSLQRTFVLANDAVASVPAPTNTRGERRLESPMPESTARAVPLAAPRIGRRWCTHVCVWWRLPETGVTWGCQRYVARMQTYDFIWQPILGGLAFDRSRFEAALPSLGAVKRADNTWVWKLSHGQTVITALNDAGSVVGFDVRVPLTETSDLVLETLEKGSAFATANTLQFVDPQLSRAVSQADGASVDESYLRVARYAGAYAGVSAALVTPEPTGLSPLTKIALAVIVFLAAMYFAYEMVSPAPTP